MTSITFYGGISKIGGNCIVIEEKGKRIMLDNGMNFSNENSFYKDFLKPRTNNDLRDYLELGLVPKIPGIYGKDKICDSCLPNTDSKSEYLFKTNLISYEEYLQENGSPYISALFLSHCHLDHLRNIQFMAPEIPIYCSELTKHFIKIIDDLSDYDFLDYVTSVLKQRKGGYTPGAFYKKKYHNERLIKIIKPSELIEVPGTKGIIKVKGHPVDHSIPGAMAFEILTSTGKRIVYTGDIRFHGHDHEKERSFAFLDNTLPNPEVLITEGTRIDDDTKMSEKDVYENMIITLKNDTELSNKLIIATFPWKSISRFQTLYKVAKKLERTLVIQPKLAYTIHNLQNFDFLKIKGILKNEDIKIYLPRKTGMIYSDADYTNIKYNVSYTTEWSRDEEIEYYSNIYGKDILIKACDINQLPSDYIIQLNFYELNELIDLKAPEGSYYFNLKTEPFDEEGELEEKVLLNWISKFGLQYEQERYHASGHASGIEIKDMIKKINPKQIFPIHTEKPELFDFKNAITNIQKGKEYQI
ncbi:MAG: hypothetical protein EU543_00570 [Promethearchaeota archaeon]|nr:MAG: hypothetical protein EU543_00570 [Candidatus Lokiarchaeota archaeon]